MSVPNALSPTSYTVVPQFTSTNGQPASFALLGSYDGGNTWLTLDATYASQTGTAYVPSSATISVNVAASNAYANSNARISAVRFVVTRVTSSATAGTMVPVAIAAMSITAPPAIATLAVGGASGGSSAVVVTGCMGLGTVNPQQQLDVRGFAAISQGVGIGMTSAPLFQLQLSQDSAAKPSTNTWTVYSDRRLKNDHGRADLQRCYDIVKTLPLSRFTWKNGTFTEKEVPDRTKLGWYAQDIRAVFPKSVDANQAFGIPDCLTMNSDQVIAALYGAVQLLQSRVETLTATVNRLS